VTLMTDDELWDMGANIWRGYEDPPDWSQAPLVSRVVETFTFGLLGQLSGACGPGVALA